MFWTIFWAVFAALVCGFAVTELFNFGLGYYLHHKQERQRIEFEEKFAKGEVELTPVQQMMLGAMGGAPPGTIPTLPTASGDEGTKDGPGQYL